jgi:hypothetical protein
MRSNSGLTPQFSGRALSCDARRGRIMKWSARGVAAMASHGPLQLLVRPDTKTHKIVPPGARFHIAPSRLALARARHRTITRRSAASEW